MPIYDLEKIVAYEEKGGSKLLCSDCLDELPEEQQKLSLWNIIEDDEVAKEYGNKMFVCDECEEEIK